MQNKHNSAPRARAIARHRASGKWILRRIAALVLVLTIVAPTVAVAAPVTDRAQAQDSLPASPVEANQVRLRLGVVKDGIVAIGPQDLANAGVNPASFDPRTFSMHSLGQPVAIQVTGESDGRFDSGDRIIFFGQKFRGPEMDQKYTDERVYWLDAGGTAGPRVANVAAVPQYDMTPPKDFATTLRAEENKWWWSLHTIYLDTQDTWFWARAQMTRKDANDVVYNALLPFTVPHPAPGAAATFRVEQISRGNTRSANPDHRTTAALIVDGKQTPALFDQLWEGEKVRKVFSAPVPPGILAHGVITASIGSWTTTGVISDDVYTNYWELDYRREFKAHNGQLDFKAETAGAQEYEVSGWDAGLVWMWDISNPDQPARLVLYNADKRIFLPAILGGAGAGASAASQAAVAATSVRFRATGQVGSRYWMQAESTFGAPASISLRRPTGLRTPAGGADVVLVAPNFLLAPAQPLLDWHRAQGRRALLVDLQDVYDEFNDGIRHPKAIQAMLSWAAQNWTAPAPKFLTLVGDGHWNFKNYNPAEYPPQPNPIPPLLAFVDQWQGEVPVDARLGNVNDDPLPDVAVGRLPVNTPTEADAVIHKIINYDQNARIAPWQRRALFVSDNADNSIDDFPAITEDIITNYTPVDLQPIRAYLGPKTSDVALHNQQLAQTRALIASTLQSGVFMVQYAGHGSAERWAQEAIIGDINDAPGIWRIGDIPGLSNGGMLPIVMTFNCLDGYFVHTYPRSYSVAELMLREPDGGSIAAISPTGLGMTLPQSEFRKILLEVMFKDNVREIGAALTQAKERFGKIYGKTHYLIDTMTLFGDPALRLPTPGAQ